MWFSILLLSAMSPAQALLDAQAQDSGVAAIAYRLQTADVGLCRDVVPQSGLLFHDLTQYPIAQRATARALFGLDARAAILAVVAKSAGDKAGLRAGDRIVAVDGHAPVSALDAEDRLGRAMAVAPAELQIDRGGKSITLRLAGTPGCASRVQVIPGSGLNATADGTYVQVTAGVIAQAKDDGELASIIAHEMAHNILRHRVWLNRLGRSARNIRATEIEADRLSVYLAARAGYDALAPARFWRHFGVKTGAGIFSDGTHLRTKARVALLETVASEVAAGKKFTPAQ
jgi:beta-barrel assembly-enhancing protease